MRLRLLLLLVSILAWAAAGVYAIYLNRLRLLQYKKLQTLRELRRENAKLYTAIFRVLNYKSALEFSRQRGFVPVKPYRVFNFYPYLKGKPLIDFYFVWFGDTPSKIAKKLGVPLKVLVKYNPGLRWGYVFPGQVLIYPVSFPFAVEKRGRSTAGGSKPEGDNGKPDGNRNKADNLVPGKPEAGNGRGGAPQKLQ
jgi:hypothetical protein